MIETVVAIGILTVAVSAAISLASRGIASSILAREEITAFYLGIEAVEVIRNERDENVLRGRNWIQGLPGACFQSRGCALEVDGSTRRIVPCPSLSGCPFLRFDEATNTYNLNRGELTSFRRNIYLTETVANTEFRIIVEVEWRAGPFTPPPIRIEETLMNWSG